MSPKLHQAAAKWPTAQLARLLGLVDRRLNYHRQPALTVAAVKGTIQTEVDRRAAYNA
jgi:hypothetical protein